MKTRHLLIILLFASLVLSFCTKTTKTTTKATGKVLAQVNDDFITADQFKNHLQKQKRFNPTQYDTTEKQKEVLDELIEFKLMFQEALKEGLFDDEQVQRMMVRALTRKMIPQRYDIKDEEMKKYFEDHQLEFKEVKASHILIKSDRRTYQTETKGKVAKEKITYEAFKEAQKTKAADLLVKVKAGGNFETLAKEHSQCPSASRGGDLGYFTKKRMVPEFSEAAFALANVGDVSNVVETIHGYHVIKLTDKKVKPFDQQKPFIRSTMIREKRDSAKKEFVAKLKQKASIKIHNDLLTTELETLNK